jgi:hypothetical protein
MSALPPKADISWNQLVHHGRHHRLPIEDVRPVRLHQSHIAVFEVPSFLGMREKGGVVLWLQENYIRFFLSYISEGPL